jgi:crotonobetainyl-CoA:carnitine CoA-transferase CaiB-like acyl-CoA transferase
VGLLDGLRVLDFSEDIAGPYCTKLLADAGADVVKVESAGGDPLRRWTASGTELGGRDGALFQYLNGAKRSVTDPDGEGLLAGADIVVESGRLSNGDLDRIRSEFHHLSVVSISPFGRTGPWAHRPATEFTLQALCGSTANRGTKDREPLHAGGRLGEWIGGVYAAVGALAGLRTARSSGGSEHVDVSMLECMAITMGGYGALNISLGGKVPRGPARSVETPSIEPTADGYVGFCTVTGQQFQDFLVLIDRVDLQADTELATMMGRQGRRDDFLELVWAWTTARTTEDIVQLASLLRIPVAPIGTPETITRLDQFAERGVYGVNPTSSFLQPRPPYQVDGTPVALVDPSPGLGEHNATVAWTARPPATPPATAPLPLEGIRIVDFTAFWAGPAATQMLAALGAEVIKVESIQRPDGMRFSSSKPPGEDHWWEWSAVFQAVNVNKKGITLDLSQAEGRKLAFDLISRSDAVVENFSPRVLDNFGITWDAIHELNERTIMVRMPAFGLNGPWRDRTGFAQTMEQASGMAWITGFPDGPPIIPRGPCDPLAGMHATFALMAAFEERCRSGEGRLLEVTMVEAALNVAAEMVIEHSAYGISLARDGNRGPVSAPQGLYPCRGEEQWLALAVATNDQWAAVRNVLGDPEWAGSPELEHPAGRRLAHELIDKHLSSWCSNRDVDEIVEALVARGVPAAKLVEGAHVLDNVQLRARHFPERFDHRILGRHEVQGVPFRLSSHAGPWFTHPSPTLGEHNEAVLHGLLGLSEQRFERLTLESVIGNRPVGS